MKSPFIITTLTISSILFLFGCKKTNDPSGVSFLVTTTQRTATVSGTSATINWTSGYASATEIEFEAENNNNEIELKSKRNLLLLIT